VFFESVLKEGFWKLKLAKNP